MKIVNTIAEIAVVTGIAAASYNQDIATFVVLGIFYLLLKISQLL